MDLPPALKTTLDGDGKISNKEKTKIIDRYNELIFSNLATEINGQPVSFKFIKGVVSSGPERLKKDINIELIYSLNFEGPHHRENEFKLTDNNFLAGEQNQPTYYVAAGRRTLRSSLSADRRSLLTYFSKQKGPGLEKTFAGGHESHHKNEGPSILTKYVQKDFNFQILIIALSLAFFLGGVHALGPGHGKALVAAYLVGSRGRLKDAAILSVIVTFAHVLSVIILGVVALIMKDHFVQEKFHGWIGFSSGLLIFIIGYWMIAKRALDTVNKGNHAHGHSHSHTPEGGISLGGLFSLGIAGGMVPCPTALIVLLASISAKKILFGLLLIIFFSMGLAVILFFVGALTVTASKFVESFSEEKKFIQQLPVFSAGVVMLVGLAIAFDSLRSIGILSLHR